MQQVEFKLEQAANSSSPDREYHQIAAARLLHEAGETERAVELLAQVASDRIGFQPFLDYTLLYSKASLANDDYFQVKALTTAARLERNWLLIPADTQAQLLSYRSDILALLGENRQALNSFFQLLPLLKANDRQTTHDRLWTLLLSLPQNQFTAFSSQTTESDQALWFQLAESQRSLQGNIRKQVENFTSWQRQHPQHASSVTPPEALSSLQGLSSSLPKNLALLLPATGKLASAGNAIQEGFLAAWFDAQETYSDAPNVRFYDSNSSNIASVYATALEEGAELVIGPLSKNRVTELAQATELTVPTITLNYLQTAGNPGKGELPVEQIQNPGNLAQLGLAAEDEASQIARRAWLEGHRHALVIHPDTDWAKRVADKFSTHWRGFGGTLEALDPYQTSRNDFAPLLKPALHIDQSTGRNQRLERLLGKNLVFTPRRRQDVDMVFMIAYPNQARQIKPTLNFLFAESLPVYATSHIYDGSIERGRNRDLDNIIFSAMPWTLDGHLPDRLQPDASIPSVYRQLYALGMDAYLLEQWLGYLKTNHNTSLSGSTGLLRINSQGEISREHPWAQFKSGRVIAAPLMQDQPNQ